MEMYNVYQAKTNLSHLLDLVSKGQSVVIGKAGRPIATLIPHKTKVKKNRTFDSLKGKIEMSPDFDAYDNEIEKLFYESKIFPD
jgi:prevent-host-death family protein